MATQRDANITNYFQAKNMDKSSTENKATNSSSSQSNTKKPRPHKRPAPEPAPEPSAKRKESKSTNETKAHHLSYKDLPLEWTNTTSTTPPSSTDVTRKLQLTYHQGDMFAGAPKNCLLIHACNTQGHWGAGIAKAFKERYPKAYKAHHDFCAKDHSKTDPVPTGTTQLLAPVDGNPQHWIGCVFTSAKYGKAKDKPSAIVKNTGLSMEMLLELVRQADEGEDGVSDIRMCKINSGKFGVPWEKTEEVLHSIVLQDGWRTSIEVWEP